MSMQDAHGPIPGSMGQQHVPDVPATQQLLHIPPSVAPGSQNRIIELLEEIRDAIPVTGPQTGTFDLSPDGIQTPNGRLLYGAAKLRLNTLVIVGVGAMTLSFYVGETLRLALPALGAGNNIIVVPIAFVIERGQSVQLRSTAATFAAWVIGSTE